MQTSKRILYIYTAVNLFLLNACQLFAERSQLLVNNGFDVSVELSDNSHTFDINDDNRKLNYFVESECLFVFSALAFEIVHTDVVKRRLVNIFILLDV